MIISMAILDDNEVNLNNLRLHINKFNLNSRNSIEADFYTDPDKFLREFRHDVALLDINLGDSETNGFKVAKQLVKNHEDPVVLMVSADVDELETLDSIISKYKLKVSEVVQRFFRLSRKHRKNLMEIYMRSAEYGAV